MNLRISTHLESIVTFYVEPFESREFANLIPNFLQSHSERVFGNIREIITLHRELAFTAVPINEDSPTELAEKLIHVKPRLLRTYLKYFQNAGTSATYYRLLQRDGRFLKSCQSNASHGLSLDSFLLKPIQRLTKYQLLLEELLKNCEETQKSVVRAAVVATRDILTEINVSMHSLRIRGFDGNLLEFKRLCLQTECVVRVFSPKSLRISKVHKRMLLLFERGIMFCKEKQNKNNLLEPFLEHRNHTLVTYMGFEECSVLAAEYFDIWDVRQRTRYSVHVEDDSIRCKVIQKLSELTVLRKGDFARRDASVGPPVPRAVRPKMKRACSEAALHFPTFAV
ncbi:hypothetical protein L596_014961 [Steinernema carpocapsae]|uniref:DH domain-containing protein n=1 Tax=Steinernema carpocapsae TaxID=34508 RepID=A0A4U5NEH0_STECR|nr:hypothetical protein L596_014961 [Steinernema carpocapsae]